MIGGGVFALIFIVILLMGGQGLSILTSGKNTFNLDCSVVVTNPPIGASVFQSHSCSVSKPYFSIVGQPLAFFTGEDEGTLKLDVGSLGQATKGWKCDEPGIGSQLAGIFGGGKATECDVGTISVKGIPSGSHAYTLTLLDEDGQVLDKETGTVSG